MTERPPTKNEREILVKLIDYAFGANCPAKQQLLGLMVAEFDDDDNYRSIELRPRQTQHLFETKQRVPIIGTYPEEDGMPLDILLHIVEGQLAELEFVKADGTNRLSMDIDTSKIKCELQNG